MPPPAAGGSASTSAPARSAAPGTPPTPRAGVITPRPGLLTLQGLNPPSSREAPSSSGPQAEGKARAFLPARDGKAAADAGASTEGAKKKYKPNPQPPASPASVVSKAGSPLPDSATSPLPMHPPTPPDPADPWPQPKYHVKQKVFAFVEEANKQYTVWVEEVFFAKTPADEHSYRLGFPKHKAYRKLRIPERFLLAHPEPGLYFMLTPF